MLYFISYMLLRYTLYNLNIAWLFPAIQCIVCIINNIPNDMYIIYIYISSFTAHIVYYRLRAIYIYTYVIRYLLHVKCFELFNASVKY